jgi:hypothetical protein
MFMRCPLHPFSIALPNVRPSGVRKRRILPAGRVYGVISPDQKVLVLCRRLTLCRKDYPWHSMSRYRVSFLAMPKTTPKEEPLIANSVFLTS